MNKIYDGLTRKVRVIDVHVHLGASVLMDESIHKLVDSEKEQPIEGNIEDILNIMNRNGIDQSILTPHPGYFRPDGIKDTRKINDLTAKAVSTNPSRFPCGLGTVEPLHGDKSLEEVDRIIQTLKLKGLMMCARFQGTLLDAPMVFKIFERAAKHRIIAFVHTGGSNMEPWRLARLVEAFPEITFINAHPGLTNPDFDHNLWLASKYENIFLDSCQWPAYGFPYRKAVNAIGADRILFGDDIPYIDTSFDLIHTKLAEISDEDKELILWKNAARIFNIPR